MLLAIVPRFNCLCRSRTQCFDHVAPVVGESREFLRQRGLLLRISAFKILPGGRHCLIEVGCPGVIGNRKQEDRDHGNDLTQ